MRIPVPFVFMIKFYYPIIICFVIIVTAPNPDCLIGYATHPNIYARDILFIYFLSWKEPGLA